MKNIFKLTFINILTALIFISCGRDIRTFRPVYIGTYTKKEAHVDGKGQGIYYAKMSLGSGELKKITPSAVMTNPSYICIDPNSRFLFALSELGPSDQKHGEIFSYQYDADGKLEFIDKVSSLSFAPCHIATDNKGKYLFTSNYLGGIATMHRIEKDGRLTLKDSVKLSGSSVHPQQNGPLLHQIIVSSDNKYIFVVDKGSDKVWTIGLDYRTGHFNKNIIKNVAIQPGAGPRHMVFSNDEKFAYTLNELDNKINVLSYDGDGNFENLSTISNLPEEYSGESYASEIEIHPNGKYIYASNRGHDSVSAFEVNLDGSLTKIGNYSSHGSFPRSIKIDPSGEYLYVANQNTSNIYLYQIDKENGQLKETKYNFEVNTPVDIQF